MVFKQQYGSSGVVVNVQSINRSDPYLNARTSPRKISKLYPCYCKIDGLPPSEHCHILHGIRDCDHGVQGVGTLARGSSESKVPYLGWEPMGKAACGFPLAPRQSSCPRL